MLHYSDPSKELDFRVEFKTLILKTKIENVEFTSKEKYDIC